MGCWSDAASASAESGVTQLVVMCARWSVPRASECNSRSRPLRWSPPFAGPSGSRILLPERRRFFVVHGRVEASGKGIYAGDSVVLTGGQGVTFSDSEPHTPVVRWKKPKIDLFVEATSIR
jgi:hypothetical protein